MFILEKGGHYYFYFIWIAVSVLFSYEELFCIWDAEIFNKDHMILLCVHANVRILN